MNKEGKIVLITVINLIIILLLSSCKEESKITDTNKYNNTLFATKDRNVQLKFIFPDTIYQNKIYHGDIYYKGILDTVNTQLATNEKTRILYYSYTTSKSIEYTEGHLKGTMKLDTVGAISNDTIPFYDIKFSKLGVNYIDGIIEDKVYLQQKDTTKVRIITNTTRATHKVVVVDSTKY